MEEGFDEDEILTSDKQFVDFDLNQDLSLSSKLKNKQDENVNPGRGLGLCVFIAMDTGHGIFYGRPDHIFAHTGVLQMGHDNAD